jgi:hypothetical protein
LGSLAWKAFGISCNYFGLKAWDLTNFGDSLAAEKNNRRSFRLATLSVRMTGLGRGKS